MVILNSSMPLTLGEAGCFSDRNSWRIPMLYVKFQQEKLKKSIQLLAPTAKFYFIF